MPCRRAHRAGFTTVEIMVMIGVILLLLAILLPALSAVRSGGRMMASQGKMRQIAAFITSYAQENRDQVVPSQFDYSMDPYPGKVRSEGGIGGQPARKGTWADILWSVNNLGIIPEMASVAGHNYRNAAPDDLVFREIPSYESVFRSAQRNTRIVLAGDGVALPAGTGAHGLDVPGYFAANNFFNADASSATTNGWYTMGQIRRPSQSAYLVDSFAGLVIEDEPDPFDGSEPAADSPRQVDFRYAGQTLFLYLDGSVADENSWADLDDLENKRNILIRDLTTR